MTHRILIGADVHDATILGKIAVDRKEPHLRSFSNTPEGREAMISHLKRQAEAVGGAEIILAYEASGVGFGLYDELQEAGITCHVLAPTKIERSPKHRSNKTDERDAERLLQIVRNHLMAGDDLPAVWVPDPATRDDRELVRAQRAVTEKLTAVKTQIRCLLKRNPIGRQRISGGWTNTYCDWLRRLSDGLLEGLGQNARLALASLLRQMRALDEEITTLNQQVAALSRTPRYAGPMRELLKIKGVGILTGMIFLTEMGDLTRFPNRRKLAAFLGLVPTAHESGKANDRKGHITRQGPYRVRHVLCQAVWTAIRSDPQIARTYQTLLRRNPRHKKIAVVALMRRLSIRMWHAALRAGPPVSGDGAQAA